MFDELMHDVYDQGIVALFGERDLAPSIRQFWQLLSSSVDEVFN